MGNGYDHCGISTVMPMTTAWSSLNEKLARGFWRSSDPDPIINRPVNAGVNSLKFYSILGAAAAEYTDTWPEQVTYHRGLVAATINVLWIGLVTAIVFLELLC